METGLLIFVLGAVFAVGLNVFISELTLRREKRKEAWIRRLNSYENFYRAMTGVIDLLAAGVRVPEAKLWEAVGDARKSAYDAASYDPTHPERTSRMQELTLALILAYQRDEASADQLGAWRNEIEQIRASFYASERVD